MGEPDVVVAEVLLIRHGDGNFGLGDGTGASQRLQISLNGWSAPSLLLQHSAEFRISGIP